MFYFINLSFDEGRMYMIKSIIEQIGGIVMSGVDIFERDDNGVVHNWKEQRDRLEAGKIAKINAFAHFLKETTDPYLWLFEDNIIFHKDFMNRISTIQQHLNERNPMISFVGGKYPLEMPSDKVTDSMFSRLPFVTGRIRGSFGAIYRRDAVQALLTLHYHRIGKKYKGRDFDGYYMALMRRAAKGRMTVSKPYMVIPNFTYHPNADELYEEMSVDLDEYLPGYLFEIVSAEPLDATFRRWYPVIRRVDTLTEGAQNFISLPRGTKLLWNGTHLDKILEKSMKYLVFSCPACNSTPEPTESVVEVVVNGEPAVEISDEVIFYSRFTCGTLSRQGTPHGLRLDDVPYVPKERISLILEVQLEELLAPYGEGKTYPRKHIAYLKELVEKNPNVTAHFWDKMVHLTMRYYNVSKTITIKVV